MSTEQIAGAIAQLPLVDHHVHSVWRETPTAEEFELMLTEGDRLGPEGTSLFDSQVGLAILRWCPPILDLPAHSSPEDYLSRRRELGPDEVNRRLLRASGIGEYLIETGFRGEVLHSVARFAELADTRANEVARLEAIAEGAIIECGSATQFADLFRERLSAACERAVGLKSIIAYRYGLDFDPDPPGVVEVQAAAGRWLRDVERTGAARMTDPVLLRYVIWAGLDCDLPLQFHVGYGDPDLDLASSDPLLMTTFLKQVRPRHVPIMLLHNYPFHRRAGYLAEVFPDVYLDVGLGVNYTGARSGAVIKESLELAPFGKVLFSSDAWGLAELHFLGAHLWRRGMTDALAGFVDADEWSVEHAIRVAELIGVQNARRVYRLR